MPRELLVLRHAKSSWGLANLPDFDRPLAPRGVSDASILGEYISEKGIQPNLTITSAAQRARETTELVLATNPDANVEVRDSLYHAGLATLVNTVREQDDGLKRLMLVGHNPGMEIAANDLVTGYPIDRFVTCAVARIEFDIDHWALADTGSGRLLENFDPKSLG